MKTLFFLSEFLTPILSFSIKIDNHGLTHTDTHTHIHDMNTAKRKKKRKISESGDLVTTFVFIALLLETAH